MNSQKEQMQDISVKEERLDEKNTLVFFPWSNGSGYDVLLRSECEMGKNVWRSVTEVDHDFNYFSNSEELVIYLINIVETSIEEIKDELERIERKFPHSFKQMLQDGKINEVIEAEIYENLGDAVNLLYFKNHTKTLKEVLSSKDYKKFEEQKEYLKTTYLQMYLELIGS